MDTIDSNLNDAQDLSGNNEETQENTASLEVWNKPTFKSMPLDDATADPYDYGYSGVA